MSALSVFESVTIEQVRIELAEKQKSLDELVAERQREIDALRVLEKALLVRRDGVPQKKPRGRRKKEDEEPPAPPAQESRTAKPDPKPRAPNQPVSVAHEQVFEHLKNYGAKSPIEIQRAIPTLQYQQIYSVLNSSPQFKKSGDGRWSIVR